MRLKSARLTNTTLVSHVDDLVGALEKDLADSFGFDLDVDITESAFLFDNSGRITKALVKFKPALGVFPAGAHYALWHITNSTNAVDSVAGIVQVVDEDGAIKNGFGLGGFAYLGGNGETVHPYNFDDSFPGLVFLAGTQHANGTGYWAPLGALFTSSSQGLVPRLSGSAEEFLCSDGSFHNVSYPADCVGLLDPISPQGGTSDWISNTTQDVSWVTEDFDRYGLHGDLQSKIVIATAGKYHVHANLMLVGGAQAGTIRMRLLRKRAAVDTEWSRDLKPVNTFFATSLSVEATLALNVSDELRVELLLTPDSGIAGTYQILQTSTSTFNVSRFE